MLHVDFLAVIEQKSDMWQGSTELHDCMSYSFCRVEADLQRNITGNSSSGGASQANASLSNHSSSDGLCEAGEQP